MRSLPRDATPNLGLEPGTTQRAVLLVCGEDPETVDALMDGWGVRQAATVHHREFHTSRRAWNDVAFTCCITGLGSASVEVAFNELFATGGRDFVHTGTAATLHPDIIPVGIAVVVETAIRDDGASLHYVAGSERRVAGHPDVLSAIEAAADPKASLVRAVGLSADAFYGCGAREVSGRVGHGSLLPLRAGLVPVGFEHWLLPRLRDPGPYCLDMEVATLYALASCVDERHGVRWGSVKGISNQIPFTDGEQTERTDAALIAGLSIALRAVVRLAVATAGTRREPA
jgi:uridine phosphorylase